MAVLLRINVQGAEKLKAVDDGLKKAAATAKAAAAAASATGKATAGIATGAATAGAAAAKAAGASGIGGLPPVLTRTAAAAGGAARGLGSAASGSKKVATHLKAVEHWATRTALKIDLLTAALLYMVDTAMKGAAALENFALSTGLSPTGLQQAQAGGVRAGITPQEMAGFVTNLQTQGVNMRLTGAGVGPWSLLQRILGVPVDPRGDPLKLIGQLHQGLMKLRPDQVPIARVLAGQAGIGDNIFAALRNPEFNTGTFNQMYEVTTKNLGNMNKLNAEWASLGFNITSTKNAFVSEFAPAMTFVAKILTGLVGIFSAFVGWLDRGSVAATVVKFVLGGMAVALGLAAIAASTMALALGAIVPVLVAVDLGLLPILGTVGAIAAGLLAIAGAVGAIAYYQHKLDQGDSVGAKSNPALRAGTGAAELLPTLLPGPLGVLGSLLAGVGTNNLFTSARDLFTRPTGSSGNSSSISQANTFNVNEAGNPQRTVGAVSGALKGMLNAASYSAPAYSR